MEPWVILGDSHVESFQLAAERRLFGPRAVSFCGIGGATAVGMRNPNSATNALVEFRRFVAGVQPPATIVIQLGEVDCGFVVWYRARKYAEPVLAQVEASLVAYVGFVRELLRAGHRVVATGAVLPTIRDGQDFGEVANARREVTATLLQRTRLTLKYNAALRSAAERLGSTYCDITGQILDASTGLIRDEYRHPDPHDHHLHPELGAAAWARALNRAVAPAGCEG